MATTYLTIALSALAVVLIIAVMTAFHDKKKFNEMTQHLAVENKEILDTKRCLHEREVELKKYETQLNAFAETLYLDTHNSREISSRYCVSESDLKTTKPAALEKKVKQQLAKNVADYICREFTPKKTESNGRTIYILSIRAKQL